MSNEIQISYATGQTLRAALYDADTTSATVGYVWDGTEYVAVGSLVGTSWRITLTEIGSTGEYRGDLPAELVGTPVRVKVMSGATPGIGDAEVAGGVIGAESGGADVSELEDAVEELQDQVAALTPGSGSVAPAGATNLQLLELSYNNLAIALANATASPKPNYTEGGRTVSWADYLKMLRAEMASIREQIIAEQELFELITEGV